jgi:alpha-1,2-mannosyltransferase
MADAGSPGSLPLSRWQKYGLIALAMLLLGFGVEVVRHSALLEHRHTDAGVYFRAAWAVRTGVDLYAVADDNGWHYVYPPLFAIVLTPLADAPAGEARSWMLPYPVLVAVFYYGTLLLGLWGVWMLAGALEETALEPPARSQRYSRRWWALRVLPLLICLPAIGRAQNRGQIGLVMVLLLAGMSAAMLRRKRFSAGLWLAGAICIKVIPVFLLLLPLWRRDWKMLLGCAVGLVLGLGVIPAAIMGPRPAVAAYRSFYTEVLRPGATGDTTGSRGAELTGINSTDTNSPMAVMHHWMYPVRDARPDIPVPAVRLLHWLLAAGMTGLTLLAAGWRRPTDPRRDVLFLGALTLLMLTTSPVFHPHYMAMAAPLVMVLLVLRWKWNGSLTLGWPWHALFIAFFASHLLTVIGGPLWFLRDLGLVLATTLALWFAAVWVLRAERGRMVTQASAGTR